MRRRLGAVALGVLVTAVLAACGNPAGVDADLTDDWKAPAQPAPFVPAIGACHLATDGGENISALLYNPRDCDGDHWYETVHVGQFTGAHAERVDPPAPGSPPGRLAYAECDAKAKEYVGADWRSARLRLQVLFPTKQGWSGGGRWFRCDLAEIDSIHSAQTQRRSGRLRDVLKTASPLAYGCFTVVLSADKEQVTQMNQTACTKAHRTEFVGIWTAPDTSHAEFEKNPERAHAGCRILLARFAKVPNDRNLPYRAATIYYHPTEYQWKAGNRGVKCFLWVYGKEVTRSMKNAGPNVLKIR